MTLEQLIGAELVECTFGKMWVRLIFIKISGNNRSIYWIDTNNKICSGSGSDASSDQDYSEISKTIFPSLEAHVESFALDDKFFRLLLSNGQVLSIIKDSDPTDELLKMTNSESMEWFVV